MLSYFYNSIIRMIILMFHNTVNKYELYICHLNEIIIYMLLINSG